MKKHFIIYFLFLTTSVYSQKKEIDYCFITLKSGFCEDSSKKCKRQQIDYLTSCEKIGNYFYSSKNYDSAFFYYSLPSELNDHSTIFQTDFARDLRNRIIAKAGDMKISGVGTKPDTLSAYYFHYQFPLSQTVANKLSLQYFKTLDVIFNFGRYDDGTGTYWQFELNPFMIFDTGTTNKIISEVVNSYNSQKRITLKFIEGSLSNEELQALYYKFLNKLKKSIKEKNIESEIQLDMDSGGGHMYLSQIAIPSLQVSFN